MFFIGKYDIYNSIPGVYFRPVVCLYTKSTMYQPLPLRGEGLDKLLPPQAGNGTRWYPCRDAVSIAILGCLCVCVSVW